MTNLDFTRTYLTSKSSEDETLLSDKIEKIRSKAKKWILLKNKML